jgi:hypothetical protein
VELILSASIAGVVSTGPEDAADGFEAGQSHRLALLPAIAVEARASIAAPATSVARVSHGWLGWSGDLDDGWHAVGGDQLDGDRVADAVMAPLANVTGRASSRSMRCRLLPGRRDVLLTAHRCRWRRP